MRNISEDIKNSIINIFPVENTIAIIIFGSYGTSKQNQRSDIDIAWIPKTKVPITELTIKTQALKKVIDIDIDLKIVTDKFTIELRRNIFEGEAIYESNEYREYLNHFYVENSDVIDILDWRDTYGS